MKFFTKIFAITAIFMLSTFSTMKAQYQIPNSGFETFQTGFNGVGQQPTGWKGSNINQTVLGINVQTVLINEEAAGRTGKCVYIHNEESGTMGITAPAYAYISLGEPWANLSGIDANTAIGGCLGGLNFTYRPDTLEVWIKRSYTYTGSKEKARIVVYLWSGTAKGSSYIQKGGSCRNHNPGDNNEADVRRKNPCTTTQFANLIGEGEWAQNPEYSEWTLIKVPITYYNNDIPEKINIFISAADYPLEGGSANIKTGSRLWADDLNLIYSSKIQELRYWNSNNNMFRPIPGTPIFNSNTNTYDVSCSLGVGATGAVPAIQALRSSRQLSTGTDMTVVNGVIDGAPTVITVTAEDCSSTSVYRIFFISTPSINAAPANILVNGNSINFNPNVTSYNIALPFGTTTCPSIEVIKAEDAQTYTTTCTGIPGTATVKVFAQDISVSKTYTLNFTVAQLSDNTLQDIKINGVSIPGFLPNLNQYNVELPVGTTQNPTIEWVSAYPQGAQIVTVTNGGLSGTTTIKVSVPNNPSLNERTYRITFTVSASSYAYLNDIKIGGVSISDFNSEKLNYNHILARGTTSLPPITWTLGQANQTVSVSYGGVDGETRITVTAQNGTTKVYRINFSVERSEVSTLNNILLDGVSVLNFNPETLIYDIELPSGTTALPEITYTLGDAAQTVRVTANDVNGTTTIRVSAENPQFFTVYKLNFSVARSENSLLNAIIVSAFPIQGFSPEIFDYNYLLPSNATYCPHIDVVKGAEGQQVFITKPALEGVATIRVISEMAGGGENIYTINFRFDFTLSGNNSLNAIELNGEPLEGFNSEITLYTVDLQPNMPAPVIEYSKSDPKSNVFVIDNGLTGVQVEVTAENGATRTYSINYNIIKTDNVNLNNIEIWNTETKKFVKLSGFNPQNTQYRYSLEKRTKVVPAINPVAAESGQVITVFYNTVNDTTEILVVSPNGENEKTYKIYFPVEKSSYRALSSITVDSWEIQDLPPYTAFNPQVLNYNITLPYGTNQTPTVDFKKGKIGGETVFEQKVEMTSGSINEPYELKVIAEDGSTRTYTLRFSVDMTEKSSENYLENILVNNIPVENFNSETPEYNVVLPYGTTEIPEISFTKKYPEQTVAVDLSGVWGASKIKVFSNISGVATKEYTINFSVSDIPNTILNSISFNDVVFEGFDPKVHTYVVPVEDKPYYSCEYNQYELFLDEISALDDSKKLVLKVSNQDDLTDFSTYTFWYHYVNDVIPNPSFEDWSDGSTAYATYTKPTGWSAPADGFERLQYKALLGSAQYYNSGREVQNSEDATHGSHSAYLEGTNTNLNTYRYFSPGILTLGTVEASTAGGGLAATTPVTTVKGGINFRNTPDEFNFEYKWERSYTSNANNANMRALVQLWNSGSDYSAAQSVANLLYTGNSTVWTQISRPITYTDANKMSPQRLNIILNASHSENVANTVHSANISGGTALRWGKLWVDNLSFGYSSVLTNIYVNGVPVPGFNGKVNDFEYQTTVASDAMPVITYTNEVADQEVRVSMTNENANRQRTVTLVSKAEDGSTTEYSVVITRLVSEINTLAGIVIDGMPIEDFAANNFVYNAAASNGTIYAPDIFAIKGEGHQNISYSFGNKKVTINVKAENGNVQTYTVNFTCENPDNSTLANLEVVGYDFEFDAQQTEYEVVLPSDMQNIPSILFTKNSEAQTVKVTTCAVNGTAKIHVTAEDKVNSTDYVIIFSTEPVATSHLLSEILVGSAPVSNFEQNNFEYFADFGKVVFTREFSEDVMNVAYYSDFVKCSIGENTYLVSFENEDIDNAYLANIAIDGISISNYPQVPHKINGKKSPSVNGAPANVYQPTQLEYTIKYDGDHLPDILVESGAEGQTITHVWDENTLIISVTARDEVMQNEYVINFIPAVMSSYALLENILINGISINNFVLNTFDYSVTLPENATVIPVVQAVKGEENQTIAITTNGINGKTEILVTAQDGTQETYTVNFKVALSSNAFLTELSVGGLEIDDFSSQNFYYTYSLPYGTTTLPEVAYIKANSNQTVAIQSNGVRGNYIITVTSESGQVVNHYIIAFSVMPSANGYLESILANGVEINNFDYDNFQYTINVGCGGEIPEIRWVANDYQRVTPTYAQTLDETTKLVVTSENGVNQNTYTISFVKQQSSNVRLADIIIGGESLKAAASGYTADVLFDEHTDEYIISLPYVITELPIISAVAQGAESCSDIEIEKDINPATITVTSQDGTDNTYTLHFVSGYSKLDNILIDGVSLESFDVDKLIYRITYEVGTPESELLGVENITYVLGEENQSVSITINEDYTIVLEVTAQDGNSQSVYVIEQRIFSSNNALLKDIKIDGKSLKGFNPNNFYYEYILEGGANEVPAFEGIKQDESQKVEYSINNIGETSSIFVTAEDGSENVYSILFKQSIVLMDEPTARDVCWRFIDGGVMFLSKKKNVSVVVFDTNGQLVYKADVPVAEANTDDFCNAEIGAIFTAQKARTYAFAFIYNNKKKIKGADNKFIY